jgi:hypothetical protein
MFGTMAASAALQIGQGAPAPPQPQARAPSHGLSGWFSQTQRRIANLLAGIDVDKDGHESAYRLQRLAKSKNSYTETGT